MPEQTHEERLRLAANRCGLKLITNRVGAATPRKYALRPIWDATLAVLALPDGGHRLIKLSAQGRRTEVHWLPLDGIAQVLANWTESRPCAPARTWEG